MRLLTVKKNDPDLWSRIDRLMDHLDLMDDEETNMWRGIVVRMLKMDCGLEVDEEEIMRLVGILGTNGANQGILPGHGLYPTFSYISHRSVFFMHLDDYQS